MDYWIILYAIGIIIFIILLAFLLNYLFRKIYTIEWVNAIKLFEEKYREYETRDLENNNLDQDSPFSDTTETETIVSVSDLDDLSDDSSSDNSSYDNLSDDSLSDELSSVGSSDEKIFTTEELEEFYRCKNPFIGSFQSIGEKECRKVLKKYFGLPFKSCRPHFLINPATESTLELDCYEGSLRLAVEYQGRQHYYFTPKFHRTIEDFQKQQERDKLKAALCSRLGIYLIRVPYSVPKTSIKSFILSSLPPNYRKYRKKRKGTK